MGAAGASRTLGESESAAAERGAEYRLFPHRKQASPGAELSTSQCGHLQGRGVAAGADTFIDGVSGRGMEQREHTPALNGFLVPHNSAKIP